MNKACFVAVALAAVLLAGCSQEQATDKAPRPVRTVAVHFDEVGETISQTGEIRPRLETPMSFRLGGQLTFRAEVGTTVKVGDVIATIDRASSVNGVMSATADLATANADLELAQVNVERNRGLFDKNVASKAQLQQSEAALATATARLSAAETALANARDTLSYTDLRATQDGVVSAVAANNGQVVNAGQTVVTLISDAERDAVFDVPEKIVGLNVRDPLVEVTLLSDSAVKSSGRVRELTPSADPATRTYRVKVGLDTSGPKMPFGSAVRGSIILNAKKLVRLPASALTQSNGTSAVFVFDAPSKTVRYREVRIERYADTTILIADGLAEGDLVATSGVSKLRDGEAVLLEDGSVK